MPDFQPDPARDPIPSIPSVLEYRRLRGLRARLANYAYELTLASQEGKPDTLRALLREMSDIAGAM